jgi:uncharacterized OB-fold protein
MTKELVKEFRDGLEHGVLLVQKCNSCGKLNMYPRYACPSCQSEALAWDRVSGKGVLHSYTVLRVGAPEGFGDELPYAIGVVKLVEGVQLLCRLLPDSNGDWQSYRCDEAVEFTQITRKSPVSTPCPWFSHARS